MLFISSLIFVKMESGHTEKLCLQWNDFHDNIRASFKELREDKDFTDVTLACEDGQQIDSHKMVLVASSPFFANLLRKNKHSHPLIFMRGVKSEVLKAMVDFFYRGEANVFEENLEFFLALAAELQLKGLEENQRDENTEPIPTETIKEEKLKRVKPKQMEVVINEDRHFSEPSKETIIALSEQSNNTDLENLDATVKSMMVMTENRLGPQQREKTRICTACGKEGQMSSIMNHIESVHLSGLQIPCNICGKIFRSRHSLTVHKRTHRNGEKSFSLQ